MYKQVCFFFWVFLMRAKSWHTTWYTASALLSTRVLGERILHFKCHIFHFDTFVIKTIYYRFSADHRGSGVDVQWLHPAARIHRLPASRGRTDQPPDQEDHPQVAARLQSHGHSHWVGDGHRHGSRRRYLPKITSKEIVFMINSVFLSSKDSASF